MIDEKSFNLIGYLKKKTGRNWASKKSKTSLPA